MIIIVDNENNLSKQTNVEIVKIYKIRYNVYKYVKAE